MLKGILFDMDGVLVDSEEFICRAAIMMFKEHNIIVRPEEFIPFIGAGENKYLGGVAEKYNIPFSLERDKARTYEIYAQIVKGKIKPLEGVRSFIKKCKKMNLKLAVATSADKIKMDINLKEIGLPTNTFDATVNGLEVEKKKPNPDIFIFAAQKLGLNAVECLVVEDAVNGIKAAKNAGSRCLALTTSFPAAKLQEANWISDTLKNVPKEALNW